MTKHKDQEVPGNVLATQVLTDRLLSKTGFAVHTIHQWFEAAQDHGIYLKALRFSTKDGPSADWLCVVTVDTDEGPRVGFQSGSTFGDAVEGLKNRLQNGTFKWKEDEYAK